MLRASRLHHELVVGVLIAGQKDHIVAPNVTAIGLGKAQDLLVKIGHFFNIPHEHTKVSKCQVGQGCHIEI